MREDVGIGVIVRVEELTKVARNVVPVIGVGMTYASFSINLLLGLGEAGFATDWFSGLH